MPDIDNQDLERKPDDATRVSNKGVDVRPPKPDQPADTGAGIERREGPRTLVKVFEEVLERTPPD
jgi:hypothetical protein